VAFYDFTIETPRVNEPYADATSCGVRHSALEDHDPLFKRKPCDKFYFVTHLEEVSRFQFNKKTAGAEILHPFNALQALDNHIEMKVNPWIESFIVSHVEVPAKNFRRRRSFSLDR
jgi:hypothetical protein